MQQATEQMAAPPRTIVVMGVSGVGKTTTATGLAARLDAGFVEADQLHPPENVAAMAAGQPLDDAMRAPWLEAVAARAADLAGERPGGVVVACSALKRRYRDVFRRGLGDVLFLFLDAPEGEIRRRLRKRRGHFMPPSLLASQFATLERPDGEDDVVRLAVDRPMETILDEAVSVVRRRRAGDATDGRGPADTEPKPGGPDR